MLKLEKTQKIKNVWVSALRGACLRNQVHDRPDMLSKLRRCKICVTIFIQPANGVSACSFDSKIRFQPVNNSSCGPRKREQLQGIG